MALQQGRCKNCGSIISVDTAKEDAVCMFCWAHTKPQEAVAIEANPSAYEFPNETMDAPTPEEQTAAFAAINGGNPVVVKKSQPAIKQTKEKKPTPAEIVAAAKKDIYEPTVPTKKKLLIAGISLALIVVLAGIFVPSTLNRNSKREAMRSQMPTFISGQTLNEANYSFEGQKNSYLTLVLPQAVTEAQAKGIYEDYKALRSKTYELKAEDQQEDVKVKIYASNGLLEMNGSGEVIFDQQ